MSKIVEITTSIPAVVSTIPDVDPTYLSFSWVLDQNIKSTYRVDRLSGVLENIINDEVSIENQELSNKLVEYLRSIADPNIEKGGILHVIRELERGLTENQVTIHGSLHPNHSANEVNMMLEYISYQPLIVNHKEMVAVKYDNSVEYETVDQHNTSKLMAIRGWTELVKRILSNELKISAVELVEHNGSYEVVDNNGNSIYVSNKDGLAINESLKLEQYYGWRYISDNDLILELMIRLESFAPIRHVSEIYIIPFDQKYDDLVRYVKPMILSLISDGYELIELSKRIMENRNLLNLHLEVLTRFGYQVKRHPHKVGALIVKASENVIRTESLTSWLLDAISLITQNQLPYIIIQNEYSDKIGQMTMEKRKSIVKYMALIAYTRLMTKHPYLSTSIYQTKVFDDLSIKIHLSSLEEVISFKRSMDDIWSDLNPSSWNVLTVSTLAEVVEYRWILYQKFKSNSMAFPTSDDKYNIVTNQHIDAMLLNDMSYDGKEMRISIQESFPYLEFDQSSKLSNILLTIIEQVPVITIGSDRSNVQLINRTQLPDVHTLKNPLTIFIDPSSKDPISRTSLARLLSYQYALMGWYDLGGNLFSSQADDSSTEIESEALIPGLQIDPPVRPLKTIDIGRIEVQGKLPQFQYDKEFIMQIQVNIDRSDYSCEQLTDDDDHTKIVEIPLLDIAYKRIDPPDATAIGPKEIELMTKVNASVAWLWGRGWFLSLWTTALVYGGSSLSCSDNSYAYPLDEILSLGSKSIDNGKMALQYLNIVIQTI
jgi:hypothetical protein